jgi:hypothetical protein
MYYLWCEPGKPLEIIVTRILFGILLEEWKKRIEN